MKNKAIPIYDKIYINGEWVSPLNPEMANLIYPVTGKVSGRAARGNVEDVDRAVKAAHKAFKTFSKTSKEERINFLKAFADEYVRRIEDVKKSGYIGYWSSCKVQ